MHPLHNIGGFGKKDEQKMNRLTTAHSSVIVQSEPGGFWTYMAHIAMSKAVLLGGSSVQVGDKSD
jgi:hypothetical protein